MNTNQAFEILRQAGGLRAARVIIENTQKISKIKIWYIAHALRRGVPVAKIIKQKWFYGLKFYTNRHTLDPRPDTETLVAAVIADCGADMKPNILDLGTGTGCIIASLVKNIPCARGTAIEKSRSAIRVARYNIKNLGLKNYIHIIHGSFYSKNIVREKFDIIVSNPPYIASGDVRVDTGARHDPRCALYARDNGYAAYNAIAKNAHAWICSGGKIYLEIGDGMGARVRDIFARNGWAFDRAETDLSGIERVLVFGAQV